MLSEQQLSETMSRHDVDARLAKASTGQCAKCGEVNVVADGADRFRCRSCGQDHCISRTLGIRKITVISDAARERLDYLDECRQHGATPGIDLAREKLDDLRREIAVDAQRDREERAARREEAREDGERWDGQS